MSTLENALAREQAAHLETMQRLEAAHAIILSLRAEMHAMRRRDDDTPVPHAVADQETHA